MTINTKKIKFNLETSIRIKKELEMLSIVIITRSVFYDNNKFYLYVILDECLYKVTE